MLAAELGHGFLTEITPWEVTFSESYPFLLNLYEPCTLGINASAEVW